MIFEIQLPTPVGGGQDWKEKVSAVQKAKNSDGRVWVEERQFVAEIVLDRPEKHNALTPKMYREINECCDFVNRTDSVHVVIFRGAGERAFCTGSDINALDGYEDFWAWRNRIDYIPPIRGLRKPALAALKGWALGGGLEIALACDLRVAARSTVFAAPEVSLGWTGAGGAAQHMTRLCGYGQAMKYLLSGEQFDAQEADRIGLVEWLVDDGEELAKARALAEMIAGHSTVATQAVKSAVRSALDLPRCARTCIGKRTYVFVFRQGRPGQTASGRTVKSREIEHMTDKKQKSPVPSVQKAFDVLELLAGSEEGLTMNEITETLDRTMGELYRIVVYLTERRYLVQNSDSGRYSLTLKLFELSHRHDPTERLITRAQPILEKIAARTEQSCHIGVLNRNNVLVLSSVQSPRPAGYSVRTGALFPVDRTSSGHVILAFSDD